MRRLMAYAWPGNVRQLENVIERALALKGGGGRIEIDDLPAELLDAPASSPTTVALGDQGIDLPSVVAGLERDLIRQALARSGGNRGVAARLLGLKRTTLVERLKRM
jgi:DNA-binding NtrC family response regulator